MRLAKTLLLTSTLLSTSGISAFADVNVVASIKPIHSLVAAVMEGVGEPGLIVDGEGSPHNFSMKPSQAQMLEAANVVFWVGHEMEAFLEKPLETVGANAKSVELIDAHDLIKLSFREGGAFEKHGHDDHEDHDDHDKHDDHDEKAEHKDHDEKAEHDDHDKHDDRKHDDHKDHDDHSEKAEHNDHEKHDDHAHDEKHDHDKEKMAEAEHDHGAFDAHVWLDPVNAKAMVHEIEEALVAADPDNASKYEANAEAVMKKLDVLTWETRTELAPVKGKGYIVFHDAYQYFEQRFGISATGSITVSPEVMPGAERITEIRARVKELGSTCVFAEPQFEPKLVSTVIEGTKARSGVIDPLGSSLESGSELYFDLIRNMATSIKTCLSQAS